MICKEETIYVYFKTLSIVILAFFIFLSSGTAYGYTNAGNIYGIDTSHAAYKTQNVFYPTYGGQCTAFAWGRTLDRLGFGLTFDPGSRNAKEWWTKVNNTEVTKSSVPRANSIAVWNGDTVNPNGHVAFVEAVDGYYVYIDEANILTHNGTDYGGGYDGYCKAFNVSDLDNRGSGIGTLLGYLYLPNPFSDYYYWDFDTQGTEGWDARNALNQGIYNSNYWQIDLLYNSASKSGIISPTLNSIHTNTYNTIEVRAGHKLKFLNSLQAYFEINGTWYGPVSIDYASGTQQANSQCIYKGAITYSGQIQRVRIDFDEGSDSVDDKVYIDYARFSTSDQQQNVPHVIIDNDIRPSSSSQIDINGMKEVDYRLTVSNTGDAAALVNIGLDMAGDDLEMVTSSVPFSANKSFNQIAVSAGGSVDIDYTARYVGKNTTHGHPVVNTARIMWIDNYYDESASVDLGGHGELTSQVVATVSNPQDPYVTISHTIQPGESDQIDIDGSKEVKYRLTLSNAGGVATLVNIGLDMAGVDLEMVTSTVLFSTDKSFDQIAVSAGGAVNIDYTARYVGSNAIDGHQVTNTARIMWIDNYYDESTGVDLDGHGALTSQVMATVSNPQTISIIGSVDIPGYAQGVHVSGSYGYVVDGNGSFLVIDLNDPRNPTIVGSVQISNTAGAVFVSGTYAYVAEGNFNSSDAGGLQVIDIRNPQNPTIVGFVQTTSAANALYVSNSYAYVAQGTFGHSTFNGVQVINVSNPQNPIIVGSIDTPSCVLGVHVSGSYAYITYTGGFQVVDVSTPQNLSVVGSLDISMASSVYVSGSYAYVTSDFYGLHVIDVSNPHSPSIAGDINLCGGGMSWGVYLSGSYAYVASGGLNVIDVSSPEAPALIASIATPGTASMVHVSDTYAYVTDGDVQIVDVSEFTVSNAQSCYVTISHGIQPDEPNRIDIQGNKQVKYRITISNTGDAAALLNVGLDMAGGDLEMVETPAWVIYDPINHSFNQIAVSAGSTVNIDYTARYVGSNAMDGHQVINTARIMWIDNYYDESTGVDLGGHGALTSGVVATVNNPFSVSPSTFDFGDVKIWSMSDTKTFIITNISSNAVTIDSVEISGKNHYDFCYTSNCSTLGAGGACTIDVEFSPRTVGVENATLSIYFNDPNTLRIDVPLNGTGIDSIRNIGMQHVTNDCAVIKWSTTEPSDSQVEYRINGASDWIQTPMDSNIATRHSVIIQGLNSGTTYDYRTKSKDELGNIMVSDEYSFTTPKEYSTDPLDNWRWRNPKPQGNTINGIEYGNGIFVAVGEGGTVLTSSDGGTWTLGNSKTYSDLNSIIYDNDVFVAVGGGYDFYIVLTSLDGITWTVRALGTGSGLNSIVYGNNTFIAVAGNDKTLSSTDGISWEVRDTGVTCESFGQTYPCGLSKIIYANDMFVAINGKNIYTSLDGETWTNRHALTYNSNPFAIITYGNGVFVVAQRHGDTFTSSDGLTWTENNSVTSSSFTDMIYNNGVFISSGYKHDYYSRKYTQKILTSDDGVTWNENDLGISDYPLSTITCCNGIYLVTAGSEIITSPDGLTWTKQTSGTTVELVKAAYGNDMYVVVGGNNGWNGDNASYIILSSPDGKVWTEALSGTGFQLSSVIYANGMFVAVGGCAMYQSPDYEYQYHILTSSDGLNWTEAAFGIGDWIKTLCWGNQFVATGYNGTIYTSPDGVEWTGHDSGFSGFDAYFKGVAYGNDVYVVIGGHHNSVILTSPDGETWTKQIVEDSVYDLNGITFGNGIFCVSVHEYGTLTSPDGVIWTHHDMGDTVWLSDICYAHGSFVFTSCYSIFTSSDGVTLNERVFRNANYLYGVSYVNDSFMAVGEKGTILQSDSVHSSDTTPPVTTADPAGNSFINSITVTLTSNEPATIYYTTDGSTPDTTSAQYTNPIQITDTTILKYFAKDTAGNSENIKSETYIMDAAPTVISGLPAGKSTAIDYVITINGNGVVTYKYKLDDDSWSEEKGIGSKISLNGLSASAHTLYVIGKDSIGNWQEEANANTVTWEIIEIAPGDINGDGYVDMDDAILALQINSNINPAQKGWIEADVNEDGRIGMVEIIYILQKVTGLRSDIPIDSDNDGISEEQVILQPGPGQGKDIWTTSVYSYAPGGGGPGGGLDNENLRVGGWADTYLILLEFDLIGLPQHATSAVLKLYNFSSNDGTSVSMYLDRITESWDWDSNDRLWWADRPSTTQWSPSTLPAPVLNAWYSIDITELYNAWHDGTYANYGFQLRPTAANNRWNVFYSSDYVDDPALRPKLIVSP